MVVRNTSDMIKQMAPVLKPGRFAYRTMASAPDIAIGTFAEDEGLSVLLPAGDGEEAYRQITLQVHSSLDGVGLTAAVATALAEVGVAANVIAAHHHDHVFVPEAQAELALDRLKRLAIEGV